MNPGHFKMRLVLAEMTPVLIALPLSFAFFFSAVPFAVQDAKPYAIIACALVLLTRIPSEYIKRRWILAPFEPYLRAGDTRRSLPRGVLSECYMGLARFVPRMQILACGLWVVAGAFFLAASWFWIRPGFYAICVLVLNILVAMAISLSSSYFFFKRLAQGPIEEIASLLTTLPRSGWVRIGLGLKIGLSVLFLTILGFLLFASLVTSKFRHEMESFALVASEGDAQALAGQIQATPEDQRDALLVQSSGASRLFFLVDTQGNLAGKANAEAWRSDYQKGIRLAAGRVGGKETLYAGQDLLRTFPIDGGKRLLVLAANPETIGQTLRTSYWITLGFLVGILFLLGIFVLWLSRDTSRVLRLVALYNKHLAEGDLTQKPSLWSDDELGDIAESLRGTFFGLNRMTREVLRTSSLMDEEIGRLVGISGSLSRDMSQQNRFVEDTVRSVNATELSMMQVSKAMEQVANATQEVSSTILEMQASVEEIAGNAEVLTRSVEKTVTSSNQIAASAEEITGATDVLHQNSQDAVSFLTELDAALEETHRNGQALSESSVGVTRDAEAGFNTVAAVEEGILQMSRASAQNQQAVTGLGTSIERIGKIIDVIQDITEQTNLLSLNASIIAAGAGEYGKSFSVVATQIRELSARTAGNAKEIREMIRSIKQGGEEISTSLSGLYELVDKSLRLSRAAGESLRTILESASNQEEMSKRIAIATDELAHGGQSASRTMQRIFTMIEGITKASQEQAHSTRYLNEEGERVREVAFQLKTATDEQAKGARVISEAVARITDDSQQSSATVQAQAKESRATAESMRRLSEATRGVQQAFQQLAQSTGRLQQSARNLSQELRSFKVSSE